MELCEGDDGDRMEESRRGALSALEELETGENHKSAFELLASIDLRGGKKGAWSDGELASVKEALKLVRELARAELRRGIVVLEPGPADERLASALPVLRDAFGRARAFLTEAKRRSRVLDFADLEVHALGALEHEEVQGLLPRAVAGLPRGRVSGHQADATKKPSAGLSWRGRFHPAFSSGICRGASREKADRRAVKMAAHHD